MEKGDVKQKIRTQSEKKNTNIYSPTSSDVLARQLVSSRKSPFVDVSGPADIMSKVPHIWWDAT